MGKGFSFWGDENAPLCNILKTIELYTFNR